jgi:TolA-binding protein
LDDFNRAGLCFRRVLADYTKARPETRRRAILGLAEIAVMSGDAEGARKRLIEAAHIPVGKSERGGEAVRVGSLSRAIEDYIRRKEHSLAEEMLDTWEWEYPLDRLVGYSTVLRAKLHISRGERGRAIRLLTSLVKVNPGSNYADEALLIAGDCLAALGDKTKARDTYKRILSEYPESPLVKEALARIESLK